MEKYIIDVKDGETLYKAVIAPDGEPYITPAMGNVYTEPDLEQVRKEAYQRGYCDALKKHCEICEEKHDAEEAYQQGLNDAWEAARKIANMPYDEEERVFGSGGWAFIEKHTAAEAIEKIRQYEQEKEELGIHGYFKHGEEVIDTDGTKAVILRVSEDNYCQVYTENGCIENWHIHTYKFHKTGRYFTEISTILEKMREG